MLDCPIRATLCIHFKILEGKHLAKIGNGGSVMRSKETQRIFIRVTRKPQAFKPGDEWFTLLNSM